jgi:hypothetical protein
MKYWIRLSESDYDKIWDKFYADFSFKPSTYSKDWPSIKTEKPTLKFDISHLWGDSYNETIYDDFIKKAIDAFVEIANQEDQIFALDWQHECFYLDPRQLKLADMEENESSIRIVSFIPNGDYYIFITEDFENIWFGHPWEKTITIIGNRLIDAFNKNKPLYLLNEKQH